MHKHTLFVLTLIYIPTFTWAYPQWELPGVEIVTRAQRGADELLRIRHPPMVAEPPTEQTQDDQADCDIGSTDCPVNPYEVATTFLQTFYPQDLAIDQTIAQENGQRLTRPYQYSHNKRAIVIHHTASDQAKIDQDGIIKHLQNVYRFHTITRGRGDIGYHFLIDANGTIYEGKAGWPGVNGAHTRRNNPHTLGISLIGNFDEQEPTLAAIESLVQLAAALADYYQIDPQASITYHEASDEHPYIQQREHRAIIGHQDAGNTSCPGHHLYEQLSDIQYRVEQKMLATQLGGIISNYTNINNPFLTTTDTTTITIPYSYTKHLSCQLISPQNITLTDCTHQGNKLHISLKRTHAWSSGPMILALEYLPNTFDITTLTLLYSADIQALHLHVQQKNEQAPLHSKTQKKGSIPRAHVDTIIQRPVRVLLRELSTQYSQRSLTCPQWCQLTTHQGSNTNTAELTPGILLQINRDTNNQLQLSFPQQGSGNSIIHADSMSIDATTNQFNIVNYNRTSYAGIPRNTFRGKLHIQTDTITDHQGSIQEQIVLINELPLTEYLLGIAETNDQEPLEKNKVMAILAKQYMTFYLYPKHRHPSIPRDANYNAIDDPNYFQKYVWAWLEQTLTYRPQAVQATQDEFLLYQDKLVILPYFTCSPGYTRSARQKRWRTDAPYLPGVIDIAPCDDFQWHGVGLAGHGATRMAQASITYPTILSHYYPGTTLTTIK